MNRTKKIILLVLLPFMLEIVVSCCDCEETTFLSYTNCALVIDNLDNSGPKPIVSSDNSISKNAYGIKISIDRSESTCQLKKNNSLFINSAYAFSCDCPPEFLYNPLDSIASFDITSINDFDSDHLQNSDVTELFYVYRFNEFNNVDEYLENSEWKIPFLLNPTFEFDILLMSPPTMGIDHQFEITIELSDGRILNGQTGLIELF